MRSLAVVGLLALIALGAGVAGAYAWASYHLWAARSALNRYHTTDAIAHLKISLTVWPHDSETLILAARASRRAGSLDEAARCLDRCHPLHGNKDEDLLLERTLLDVERGELEGTKSFCDTLVTRNDPATPLVLEALGKGCLRMYRSSDADRALNEWLERQPDNPQALDIQGQVRELQLRPEDAVACYRRAVATDPELNDARRHLCAALMQLGHTDEALPHLEYLNRRDSEDVVAKVHLARARAQMGQTDEAENLLRDVLSRWPQFAPALAERGKLALQAGRSDEAEKWLRQAITLEPSDFQAHYQLFLCLQRNGKAEEARQEQARFRAIEADAERLQKISTIQMQKDPHNADLHYQAGMIALRTGNAAEGLRWLHSALREDPNHAPTHRALMEYYQRIRDFQSAREHRAKLTR